MSDTGESLVKVRNLSKSFGKLKLLKDISFDLKRGSVTGLIGPSGCGKSVLLKILGGVLKQDSGTIEMFGVPHDRITLMFQEGALFDSLSVFDNVAFPLLNGAVPTSTLPRKKQKEIAERVSPILARVGLTHAAEKLPAQLSGGMRRRASLARALISKPELVLLDDPTCGLDPVASGVIMNLILELQREHGYTVLIVSQDLRRLIPNVETVMALFNGSIDFIGTVDQLKESADPEVIYFVNCRYDLESSALSTSNPLCGEI